MADDGKEKKGCCEKLGDGFSNFGKFLYNNETKQVMGRSGESWLKIGVFYLIFYGFLAAFFSAMLTVFLSTLNNPEDGGPKLTQFIKNKPGLSYTSLGQSLKGIKNGNTTETTKTAYTNSITAILEKYTKAGVPGCQDSVSGMGVAECTFNQTLLGDCSLENGKKNNFGLDNDQPCVYVRINKVYDWVPEQGSVGNYLELACTGDNDANGITVTPAGFHIGSFPFRGQKDFELPLVSVKVDASQTTEVICVLKGPGIEVSESSVPHRAFGKVKIS
jgi:sodium/potassium-transporting ATPase subunit beta